MLNEDKGKEHPFHYIKNESFRTSFASGVVGGITINGYIDMNFYIDRPSIPVKTILKFEQNPEASVTESIVENKDGSIREVSTGIIMDLNTAKNFHKWLGDKISILETHIDK